MIDLNTPKVNKKKQNVVILYCPDVFIVNFEQIPSLSFYYYYYYYHYYYFIFLFIYFFFTAFSLK